MSTFLTVRIEARAPDVIPGGDDLVVEVTVPAYSNGEQLESTLTAAAQQAVAQTLAAIRASRPSETGDSTA